MMLINLNTTATYLRTHEHEFSNKMDDPRWNNTPYPDGLLRCQLIVYSYVFVFDPALEIEARCLIKGWKKRELTNEETELIDLLEQCT